MDRLLCDFCCSRDKTDKVAWRYPAKTFSFPGATSHGDWAACETCHDLIEAGDKKKLLERSFQKFVENENAYNMPPIWKRAMTEAIREIQNGFFQNRAGIARREK